MGKVFEGIDDRLRAWLLSQPMFFVGTAPSGRGGHINVSPKGLDGSFAVIDCHRVAYLDHTGSGVETIAHLRDNGRIVLMFCAFTGPPRIVRLHGRGETVPATASGFADLAGLFAAPESVGVRSIIVVEVTRASDSCGYGVPQFELVGQRPLLPQWAARQGDDGIAEYRAANNATSIDGLPGLASL